MNEGGYHPHFTATRRSVLVREEDEDCATLLAPPQQRTEDVIGWDGVSCWVEAREQTTDDATHSALLGLGVGSMWLVFSLDRASSALVVWRREQHQQQQHQQAQIKGFVFTLEQISSHAVVSSSDGGGSCFVQCFLDEDEVSETEIGALRFMPSHPSQVNAIYEALKGKRASSTSMMEEEGAEENGCYDEDEYDGEEDGVEEIGGGLALYSTTESIEALLRSNEDLAHRFAEWESKFVPPPFADDDDH
ncbi:hypothetical protein QOT17_000275 [Balamuthia mandrillaris]